MKSALANAKAKGSEKSGVAAATAADKASGANAPETPQQAVTPEVQQSAGMSNKNSIFYAPEDNTPFPELPKEVQQQPASPQASLNFSAVPDVAKSKETPSVG